MKSSACKMTWLSKLSALLVAVVISSVMAFAQTKTVTGTVIDDLGEPVLGANVVVVGTTNGCTTDLDGNYSIQNVPNDATLKVSFIGYSDQLIPVAGKSVINITLKEDAEMLEDVVVVGYGTMKKSDLTGSVASVSTEKLNAKGAPSVMENLQGSTPGVNITVGGRVGESASIEIRGKSSLNSDTKPLFVVDGVFCSDIDWLNPQDIERIDILKDASSTAIYGSRATAGVVMVTTKSGASVSKGSKLKVSYDGYYGITSATRMPQFMDGQQFKDFRFQAFLTPVANSPASHPAYEAKQTSMAMVIDDNGQSALASAIANGRTYDWPDLVTQNGSQQNHYLSLNGGSKNVTYNFGVGYASDKGIYAEDEQQKLNVKGGIDAKIGKRVTVGVNFNVAHIKNTYANDDAIQEAFLMTAFSRPYDENGNYYTMPGDKEALGTTASGNNISTTVNPLMKMLNTQKSRKTWRALGNIYAQINIIDGMTFKTTFSPSYTHYTEDYVYGIENPNTPGTSWANEEVAKGWDYSSSYRSLPYTWDNVLNYSKTIKKDHSLNLTAIFSTQKGSSKLDRKTKTFEGTNVEYNSSSSDASAKNGTRYTYSQSSMISYAVRANYSYMGKYMATATARWDGSSKFADGNRWGCFPSMALAWRISGEEFMAKTQNWLSDLKLRLSYGVTGNCDGIGDYATIQTYDPAGYYPYGSTNAAAFAPNGIVDKGLKWETSYEYNAGLDWGLLNGRFSGTIDVYQKTSKDLLYSVQLPLVSGGDKLTTNIGEVRNRGIEASLTAVIVDNKDWHWSNTITFSHNNNEIIDINGSGTNDAASGLFLGHSVNVVYGYELGGIVSDKMMTVPDNEATKVAINNGGAFSAGQQVPEYEYYYALWKIKEGYGYLKDVNGDGKINNDDKTIRSSDPQWTGAFTSNLSYKNWDLSISLYSKQNYTVYSNFLARYDFNDQRSQGRLAHDFYIPAGTLLKCDGVNADGTYINPVYQESTHYGSYPMATNSGAGAFNSYQTDNWKDANAAIDASFVKVKNITLGYTMPKKWLTPWHCSSLRIYGTVTNPFVWTNYRGFDPEWADASLKKDAPSTVTYQIGASLKF